MDGQGQKLSAEMHRSYCFAKLNARRPLRPLPGFDQFDGELPSKGDRHLSPTLNSLPVCDLGIVMRMLK